MIVEEFLQEWAEYKEAVEQQNKLRLEYDVKAIESMFVTHKFLWWKWESVTSSMPFIHPLLQPTIEDFFDWMVKKHLASRDVKSV